MQMNWNLIETQRHNTKGYSMRKLKETIMKRVGPEEAVQGKDEESILGEVSAYIVFTM